MKLKNLISACLLCVLCACSKPQLTRSGLDPDKFRSGTGNEKTALYTLTNPKGMEVCLTNYGGRIVSVLVPDREGKMRDVVLGFDNISDYRTTDNNFGATIGRYGNRIANGRFSIGGQTWELPRNDFGHCLHGGPDGWDHRVMEVSGVTANSLIFSLVSPDGDAGFPGTVEAQVKVTLTDDNAILLQYQATTDKQTIINMTNHSYFNLDGQPEHGILSHELYLNAKSYTPIDATFMTSGEILPVAGTPMDFTTPKEIGRDIGAEFKQLENGRGYDHNWVLDTAGKLEEVAASLYSPESGILLEVYTDEPGLQVYSGNFLDGSLVGKNGQACVYRASLCLETQHYPDSPNKPDWPSTVLNPGETYRSSCIWKFSVR